MQQTVARQELLIQSLVKKVERLEAGGGGSGDPPARGRVESFFRESDMFSPGAAWPNAAEGRERSGSMTALKQRKKAKATAGDGEVATQTFLAPSDLGLMAPPLPPPRYLIR